MKSWRLVLDRLNLGGETSVFRALSARSHNNNGNTKKPKRVDRSCKIVKCYAM